MQRDKSIMMQGCRSRATVTFPSLAASFLHNNSENQQFAQIGLPKHISNWNMPMYNTGLSGE